MPKPTFFNLSEAKQQRIIDAAINQIERKGYDKTSISAIISESKIPRGSFYQYFEDKSDLFLYIVEQLQHKKMAYFKPVFEKIGTVPFIELYSELLEYGLKFIRAHDEALIMGRQIYRSNDMSLSRVIKHLDDKGIQSLIDFIYLDQSNGFLKSSIDIKSLAKILYDLNTRDILEAIYQGKSDNEIIASSKKNTRYYKIWRYRRRCVKSWKQCLKLRT